MSIKKDAGRVARGLSVRTLYTYFLSIPTSNFIINHTANGGEAAAAAVDTTRAGEDRGRWKGGKEREEREGCIDDGKWATAMR